MDTPATYVQLGFVLVSIPNLVLLAVMLALFAGALLLPFPGAHGDAKDDRHRHG